jgi:hypothetical protein
MIDEKSVAHEVLDLIESFLPTEHLINDLSESNNSVIQTITDPKQYESLINACFMNYMHKTDLEPTMSEFLAFIKNVEPFASQWKYTESYVRENAYTKWRLKDG